MPAYTNVSGTSKEVKSVNVNVGGTWKEATAGYVNVDGTWQQFWPSGWVYGVKVEIANSDPDTSVTYTDDCAGWSPMRMSGTTFSAGSWTTSNRMLANIFPVMFDGTTVTKLKKTNLAQDENGNAVSSTVDKFTQINHMWLDIHNDGTYIYVRISDHQEDSNFSDWYFSYNGTVQDCMRIGCYVASSNSKSVTGATPNVSVSLAGFISHMQGRGTGYDLLRFNQLTLVQCLFLILFKGRNGQAMLGKGYTDGSAKQTTGANDAVVNGFGMYGTASATTRMSFLWLEDFWGNVQQWIGGMATDASLNILTADKSGTSTAGWDSTAAGLTSELAGVFPTKTVGSLMGGFVGTAGGGSSSTYWCDQQWLRASCFPAFGGSWRFGSSAGPFNLYVDLSASNAYASLGSRLSYSGGQ